MAQKPPPPSEPSGDLEQVSGPVSRVRVELLVAGDQLVPDEVTQVLHHAPTRSWRKGDARPDSRYNVVQTSGAWYLDSGLAREAPIAEHMESVLAALTQDITAWRDLVSRYRVVFWCGIFCRLFSEEMTLPPSVMALMGERGIGLALDIYGGEAEPNNCVQTDNASRCR